MACAAGLRAYDLPAGCSLARRAQVLQGMGLRPLATVSVLSSVTTGGVLSMSLGAYPSVIHSLLGFTSLTQGIKA